MLDSGQARIGKKKSILMFAGLVVCGILLNILGTRINAGLRLPFYFDNIGTILTALVGGYLPCIAVGFFYNIIVGIGDNMTTYYCFISVLIAWAAAFFVRTGRLTKFPNVLVAVLTFAVIGGVGGGVLTWFLYGLSSGEGAAGMLAQKIIDLTGMSRFSADLSANLLIDLADKAISTAAALLIWKLLPKKLLSYYGIFREQIAFKKKNSVARQAQKALAAREGAAARRHFINSRGGIGNGSLHPAVPQRDDQRIHQRGSVRHGYDGAQNQPREARHLHRKGQRG